MYFKALFGTVALLFVSCSGDDTSTIDNNNNNTQPEEKKLDSIVESVYISGAVSKKTVTLFNDNNQPVSETEYDESNQISQIYESTYMGGRLIGEKVFYKNFGLETPHSVYDYFYDGQGRINRRTIKEVSEYEEIQTTLYIYNTDNTITAKSSSNIFTFETEDIFELNEQGLIKKRYSDDSGLTDEFAYDGNNLAWWGGNSHSPADIYEYDPLEPVGPYIKVFTNKFGTFNNMIMTGNYAYIYNSGNKYVTKWLLSNNIVFYEFKYEFDNDGYPVKVKRYFQGATNPVTVREIFYQ